MLYNVFIRVVFICVISTPLRASVPRIENFDLNRKAVSKIYISFSKALIIRFPEAIDEIRLGLPNFYEAEISKIYKKEITLHLTENIKIPSNLIVRTTSSKVYVFDLVPSMINHQDVVFIDDSFYPQKFNEDLKQDRKEISKGEKRFLFKNGL